jgi:hypothetical protein
MLTCIILHNIIVEDEKELAKIPIDLNECPTSGSFASTLLHVSCPIGRPMQCHIRFLMMCGGERTRREK